MKYLKVKGNVEILDRILWHVILWRCWQISLVSSPVFSWGCACIWMIPADCFCENIDKGARGGWSVPFKRSVSVRFLVDGNKWIPIAAAILCKFCFREP